MNIAYFRKSQNSLEETIANVLAKAKEQGWKVLGEVNLPENAGEMVLICRPEWVKTVIKDDYNLLGFLPCSVSVFKKGDSVLVGTGQPAIIKAISQNEEITALASEAEDQMKELIHTAAGVDELKPTHVTLYSTTSCPYCKMEKTWLEQNHLKYDQVFVDIKPGAADELIAKTGQIGVPVTEIAYDDGEPEFIVGFDKPRLASLLGVK